MATYWYERRTMFSIWSLVSSPPTAVVSVFAHPDNAQVSAMMAMGRCVRFLFIILSPDRLDSKMVRFILAHGVYQMAEV